MMMFYAKNVQNVSYAVKGRGDNPNTGPLVCDGFLMQMHMAMKRHCMGASRYSLLTRCGGPKRYVLISNCQPEPALGPPRITRRLCLCIVCCLS